MVLPHGGFGAIRGKTQAFVLAEQAFQGCLKTVWQTNAAYRTKAGIIVDKNQNETRQQAADSTDSTARRSNAVSFLF
ncbi:hypothetical protein [Neisseria sp.]|uniref:hypothetical protein n=1 Tax=Neisseria sp. TaxID=192066 RepID=UPI0026DAE696|nr:hypothetical protein [Neisseria sp.]MDO4228175.1 hypothetical protein [Neisseria sp.]